jgi:YesN/AraC family two-component response regulator
MYIITLTYYLRFVIKSGKLGVYSGLIVTRDKGIKQECESVIARLGNIRGKYVSDINEFDSKYSYFNYLFILFSDISEATLQKVNIAQKQVPDLSAIFYNRSLTISDLSELDDRPTLNFIVGENRQEHFNNLLIEIKNKYWRKIPYKKFDINYESLSPRMKKTMLFIESEQISKCTIVNISKYLDISPGYFSQEFKKETGQAFRTFMQRVKHYYEDIILSRVDLPTKNISQLLGYSELSSFSRSFKKRNGISPTKYKKLVKVY